MRWTTRLLTILALLQLKAGLFSQEAMVSSIQLDANLSLDGLLATPDGALYGTEGFDGSRLFKIEMDGATSVVAGSLNGPIDLDYDADGNLYLSTFNNQGLYKLVPGSPFNVSRFANVATGPSGVVVDRATGNIYVSHYGSGFPGNGNSIYRVTPDGTSLVFVQGNGLQVPVSLAIDDEGNLYAPNIGNARLYKITPGGDISLLAQLPTTPAHPFNIGHIAYANGFLYLTGNSSQPLIFRVSLDGQYEVIAGDGTAGYQDGPGLQAQFDAPNGIAASVTGDTLFISELNQPGILRIIALPTVSPSNSPVDPKAGFSLAQSFPNPARTASIIPFELGRSVWVNISVYNAQGQVVDTLVSEVLPAGPHTVEWKAGGLPAGAYIYRMTAGNFTAERKAVVVGTED